MSPPNRSRAVAGALLLLGAVAFTGCAASSGPSGQVPTSSTNQSDGFSQEELTTLCIDATVSAFAEDVEFDTNSVRVEERSVDPQWLVLVPAQTSGAQGEAQCTIGGTPEAPDIQMANASLEPLPEEQVQNLIEGKNEGGTQ